ncbi:polyubiquitin binding protein [Trichophyton tonsurans CBS 112818]|uniref:Polyubiquitin binding protein n=1 Tax=Trichophyton tonsurans (strain CBS 112818) TaxID=647933 RepID=F2RPE6_TRIT1|nr:polyubiquitin binding protein [Trichophyton tonsurans CBS 112818]
MDEAASFGCARALPPSCDLAYQNLYYVMQRTASQPPHAANKLKNYSLQPFIALRDSFIFSVGRQINTPTKIICMPDFKISALLEGHSDDVRAVAFPTASTALTSSRDATVRMWTVVSSPPPKFDDKITVHGSAFINSLAYCPPTGDYPEGLIFSAGQDTIIEARRPGKPADDNAERLLLGHTGNVCALAVSPDRKWLASGSWDSTGRLWEIGKWSKEVVLDGHGGSVWAVLAYDKDTVITGCADKLIRVFNTSGKLVNTFRGCGDVVRALCKVPDGHGSGAQIASAGNDGIIRLWTIQGKQVGQLHGHESFIYSLDSLPSGELVSSGEDRTVRIWNATSCIQTITHPAISVWSVAACAESGDIISGASDRIARIFSRDKVVDSVGSSGRKVEYMGQDYDYVFDVDIEDGKPPLKLPYNLSQNPYDVAKKFIANNELPISYLEQVANFITTNTKGAVVGPSQTGESTYQQPSIPDSRPKVLPQASYLSIKSANLKAIQKKISEINTQLISSGSKDLSLAPSEMEAISALCSQLEQPSSLSKSPVVEATLPLLVKVSTSWPAGNRLPGLDLLRLLAAASPTAATWDQGEGNLVSVIISSGVFDAPISPNNTMLAIRMLANFFETGPGRALVASCFEEVTNKIGSVMSDSVAAGNRNVTIAAATLYINLAIYFTSKENVDSPEASEHGLVIIDQLTKVLRNEKDSEAVYRGLVALGTLVVGLDHEIQTAAKEIYDLDQTLTRVLDVGFGREPRVKGVISEIRDAIN